MPAQDLTDLTTLKNHLKITGGDFDALLTGLVSQVSSAIESTTKRQIKERTSVTEYMDGPGKGTLSPRQSPINSIASIHVDSLRLWASTALVLTTDYAIDQSGVLIRGLGGKIFSKGVQNIKLVYDYGYATVPDDLVLACLLWCQDIKEKTPGLDGDNRFGKASEQVGEGGTLSFVTGMMPPEVRNLIRPYIRKNI